MVQSNQVNSLKILLILPFFYPHRGGSQKYAEEIFSTMIKNHPQVSVDVLCYNSDKSQSYEEYRGMRIYRIPCFTIIPQRFLLPNPFQLIKALIKLSKNKYDFVNTHIRFFDPTWWAWFYARLIGAKSIFTGHVANHPAHQNKIIETVAKIVDLTLGKVFLNFYDEVTFISKATERFFRKELGFKKPATIIYNSVDTDSFPPKKLLNRVVPKLNKTISDDATVITFIGRLIWTKGVMILLESAIEILREKNNVYFVFAGDGELKQTLIEKVEKLGLKSNMLITGELNYEEVKNLLAITNIFVNPSHHNEGLPTTLIEAGASECAVIATDNAGTNELITNGETGVLIKQKDKENLYKNLLDLIENKEEARKLAQNLKNRVQNEFDIKITSEKLYGCLTR